MVQSVNWPAIRVTARVIFGGRAALALPHLEVSTIADLDFHKLRSIGCRGLVAAQLRDALPVVPAVPVKADIREHRLHFLEGHARGRD